MVAGNSYFSKSHRLKTKIIINDHFNRAIPVIESAPETLKIQIAASFSALAAMVIKKNSIIHNMTVPLQ
jgi:hypothetical protein